MNTNQAIETIENYYRARYPIIAINSHEESRVLAGIRTVAARRNAAIGIWSVTTGLTGIDEIDPESTMEPIALFMEMKNRPADKPTIFVMLDFHGQVGSKDRGFQPILTRWLRDIANYFENTKNSLVLVSPRFSIPTDLEKTVAVLDYPLPDSTELEEILKRCENDLPKSIPVKLNGNRTQVVQALRGLTAFEASSVLLSGVVAKRELGESVIPVIIREKSQIIKKSGVLEYFDNSTTMNDVGGLKNLKTYAAKKYTAFVYANREGGSKLDCPRGVMLVGVPGTGKSLSAKAIAGAFKMPLLRMDVGALMGGLVGQSESNTRAALAVAEAVAPCVLWIDEVEKALGSQGGERDGGTSQRVLGTILTWLQETTAPVYAVATANDIRALRPELVSRFDDILFVDLPNQADREEILRVHLGKRSQDATKFNLQKIAALLWGFSGREIERVVRAAIETAFYEGTNLNQNHLETAATEIVPVTVTMKNEIDGIRSWAQTSHARPAADPLDPKPAPGQGSRIADL